MLTRDRVIQSFQQRYQSSPAALAVAPGRVNILGEHVDYNDGIVLPAAIDLFTTIAFSPSADGTSRLFALDFGQEAAFTADSLLAKLDAAGNSLPDWALYPCGVAWALARAGLSVPPVTAVFASDVPIGAGLSSSASIETAFAAAWSALGSWTRPGMEMARLGQQAENEYVGVQCGLMDQFACACGVAGRLLTLDCRTLDWRSLALPAGVEIIVADSTVRHRLTTSSYNDRRRACAGAVAVFQRMRPEIQALRDVTSDEFNREYRQLDPVVAKRARHVIEEIERTRQALNLLEIGDITALGSLLVASHASLRDLYEVSTPELNVLVEIARIQPGCFGARLTGAGFGGSTVNLVDQSLSCAFIHNLASQYFQMTGLQLRAYRCKPAAGARVINPFSPS